jgi:photoactive yellow protein
MISTAAPTDDLLARVDALTPEELDVLPFGAIQLDRHGRILRYNETESRLSRLPASDAIGRDFFAEIAPCTKVREFGGRFLTGVKHRDLDTSFRFHFPFAHGPRTVTVRLFYSRTSESVWVFISDTPSRV